jgi:uncharacterized RDD family membrane protein YckC
MALGAVDGTVTTSVTLLLAWALGLLSGVTSASAGQSFAIGAGLARAPQWMTLVTSVGATLTIRILVVFLYDTASVAVGGQTIACRLLRLRIVASDGNPVSLRGALKRAVAGGLLAHTPVVGQVARVGDYAAAIFGKRRQAVRDRVAGTMLVHARPRGAASSLPGLPCGDSAVAAVAASITGSSP